MTVKRHELLLILPAIAAMLFTPFVWRFYIGDLTLPGEYSYHYISALTQYFGIPSFSHPYTFYWLLSIAGALLSALLFYRLVTLHTTSTVARIAAPLFFAFTPVTLYLSMSVSPYLPATLLLFIGLNLIESRY
ncbi:hypothetical protein HY497_01870, partial [Candidatus Woesearchaeota archaeon]|nr:hypothetical protein [Candidatus Woesearchaeota archaeon]